MKRLRHALEQQLIEALPELLEFGGVRIVKIFEDLRREPRNLVVPQRGIRGQRVADAEAVVAHQSDDVAGIRFVHGLALVAEELVAGTEPDLFAGLNMRDGHVALEPSADHPDERDSITMLRIHVGLDLKK